MHITKSEAMARAAAGTRSVWFHREYQIYIMLEGNEPRPITEIGEWEIVYSSTEE